MKLISNDIKDNEKMNPLFTCDDADIHPHLKWYDEPPFTKSFALSCLDIDNEQGYWSHWYIVNIPKEIKEIPQGGEIKGEEIENDFGTLYYEGPCSAELHRYVFTIHAIKVEKLENLNTLNFRKSINNFSFDKASLTALYQRKIPDRIFI